MKKTYKQITLNRAVGILTQAALGMNAMMINNCIIYDAAITLNSLICNAINQNSPCYIAFREHGMEGGNKDECLERCKVLGYPLVIAKLEPDNVFDYDLTFMFTRKWMDGDVNDMQQEFNSL
jgi:hypothetical protein